jgi:hypothetical protein
MDADGNDQTVAQPDRLADDVEVTVGYGIEGSGIKRGTRHPPLYRAGRDVARRTGSAARRIFIFRRHSNHLRKFGVFLAGELFHPRWQDETKLRWDETILVRREDVPQRRVAIQPPAKRGAARAQ